MSLDFRSSDVTSVNLLVSERFDEFSCWLRQFDTWGSALGEWLTMDVLEVARLQFGTTTVYHFLFVPITIGMSMLVALLQTMWRVTGKDSYLRATKFWGNLFLITLAMGIVTGIVQEFQFGMNWSAYSRFVGDIFGAPLAFEALLAFFLEATFAGIWIFGWDKLKPSLHLACIWIVAFGTVLSGYFILAANAFMQNPVGYEYSEANGRAELTDFGAVLTNPVALTQFPHTIFASWLTAAMIMIAVSAWHFKRKRDLDVHRPALRLGVLTSVIAGIGLVISGDSLGKVMTSTQPMKMAAAEALYNTTSGAPFSVLTVGDISGQEHTPILEIPGLLSFLGTGSFGAEVQGINDLQAQYAAQYGPGDYTPYIPLTYWSFRAMIGFGMLAVLIALYVWWRTRRGKLPQGRLFWIVAVWSAVLPFVANSTGWIFTEMGRQPWVVFSLMLTEDGVSPTVGERSVWVSFVGFTLVYAILAVVCMKLFLKYAKLGPPDEEKAKAGVGGPSSDDDDSDKPMAFAY